ncbi:glycerol dehydrogenase [Leucobacter sp. W1038]|uniref:glycerol dehydrogenase n=1 Tax=Leucobacter sp. W1038 TaxID=3438281 RepID=UPI003D987195
MTDQSAELRVFSSASRYVQGPGALDALGQYAGHLGNRAVVLIDAFMLPRLGVRIERSLADASVTSKITPIEGEVTPARIAALAARVKAFDPGFIVGVGGGKAIDIAKGVSRSLSIPIVTVPTIASNDSPASRVIAVYDDDHRLAEVVPMDSNPALVVVDSEVIFDAPAKFLAAGIGDAISKRFEAEACRLAEGLTPQGTRSLQVARLIADGAYDVLRTHGPAATAAAKRGELNEDYEHTLEAVILLSGLAFENGGLSIAHAVTRGLMAVSETSAHLHGEHVAYGLLVQLALAAEADEVLDDHAEFLRSIGLPDSLHALGCEPTGSVLDTIVSAALTAPHIVNFPAPVDAGSLTDAILRVERRFG